jgi:ABC-type Fe3+ transport system substrate-binding protein/tetrahydromethanopterin S-methyltransferase subunit B
LKDADDYTWWGAALSGFGITYNDEYLETYDLPLPNDWTDLANPEYKGHVISCPPSKSGSNTMILQIILQYYGWENGWALATEIGANIGEYTEKSHHVAPFIGRGEYGIASVIDFYGFGQAAVYPEDVVFFYPPADSAEKSTVINPDSVAIIKGKGDSNPVAIEFMKWCLGKDGQKTLFKDPINRLSVRPDVYAEAPPGYFNPFETELTLFVYDDVVGTLVYDIIRDLYDMMLIAPKDNLVKAWDAYNTAKDYLDEQKNTAIGTLIEPPIALPNSDAKLAEVYTAFTSLPITGSEAETISSEYLSKKEEYKADWLEFSVEKYFDTIQLAEEVKLEVEKERNEIRTAYLDSLHSEAIVKLEAQIDDLEADIDDLNTDLDTLQKRANNNLYLGMGGGLIVGLIIGALVVYMMRKT